jgi:hypothetical protein
MVNVLIVLKCIICRVLAVLLFPHLPTHPFQLFIDPTCILDVCSDINPVGCSHLVNSTWVVSFESLPCNPDCV